MQPHTASLSSLSTRRAMRNDDRVAIVCYLRRRLASTQGSNGVLCSRNCPVLPGQTALQDRTAFSVPERRRRRRRPSRLRLRRTTEISRQWSANLLCSEETQSAAKCRRQTKKQPKWCTSLLQLYCTELCAMCGHYRGDCKPVLCSQWLLLLLLHGALQSCL